MSEYEEKIRLRSLNLRFAQEVIQNQPSRFDAVEIHGVDDLGEGIVEVTESEAPDFWSVYLHQKEGGLECVGDHSNLSDARQYAMALSARYNWPVTYSP